MDMTEREPSPTPTVQPSWQRLRRVVPSLESSLSSSAQASTRERLVTWLIGLRWVAVLASAAVVATATWSSYRVPPESTPYLWGGVVLLLAFNATLSVVGPQRLSSQAALALQVLADVAVLGWLIHHAGGLDNPFAGFFVFHAILASIVLDAPRARRVALAIAAFVLGLAAAEATGLFPPGCLQHTGGACSPPADGLVHAVTGAAVAATVVGCALIVMGLVRMLHLERDRLADATATLAIHAEHLAAAQAQVQREREHLQTIIDCMLDAVVYVSPDGLVRLRNRAAERFWPPQVLPSNGDLRACHPPEKWDRLLAAISEPKPAVLHPIFQVAERSYEANYARVHHPDGSLQGVVMVARDVTEQLQARQWQMREERMSVVGKLAAGLAHELNNPLGAIALFAQHALGSIAPDHPLSDHLGTVLRNANLCKRIVRELLEYARQRPPQRERVALGELLGDTLRTLEPYAEAARVTLGRAGVNGEGPYAFGDPDQLRQVLVNLGMNAIEAMPAGGTLTFRLASAPEGPLRIDVTDTGVGIPPEEQERIFAAFHTTKPEGTGLGLTVARDLVTAHGGTLEVQSAPGKGSTFSMVLPPPADTPDTRPAEVPA